MFSYAIVTPARNEEANLPRLAAAIRAQSRPPTEWVIVDDGSTDGTPELIAQLAAADPWIHATTGARPGAGTLVQGRREGRDLLAFAAGVAALRAPAEVVVKVDADVSFESGYFEDLLSRMEARRSLGITSGSCHELEDGAWVRQRVVPTTVWGATRAYRSECLDAALTLPPRIGWDGLDELRAHRDGWETTTFDDLPFLHHRPEHAREPGRWSAHAAQGRAAWYMGYRPTYLTLRAVYRAREDAASLAMVGGYAAAALARDARFPEADVRSALRERQRLRHALRRGAPA